jgi:hypothetical protein
MALPRGPNATIAWLSANSDPHTVAGAAFMIAPDLAITCAHVVRDHLGLSKPTPSDPPQGEVKLRFEWFDRDVSARVAPSGWWPDGGGSEIDDVAVLRLEKPLAKLDCAVLALSHHRPQEKCYIYAAPTGYQGYGKTVNAQLAGHPHPARGWYQINARPGEESGYFVTRGFSGSAVFDEMGNAIWGMVVAVETEPETLVAFAISAKDLKAAASKAAEAARERGEPISEPQTRTADLAVEELGRDAVTALLKELLAQESPDRQQQVLRSMGALTP